MDPDYNDWRVRSKCMELEPSEFDRLFFPQHGRSILEAKQYCLTCPVKMECLDNALLNNDEGVWAGTNYAERQEILKFRSRLKNESVQDGLNIPVKIRKPRKSRKKIIKKNFVFS